MGPSNSSYLSNIAIFQVPWLWEKEYTQIPFFGGKIFEKKSFKYGPKPSRLSGKPKTEKRNGENIGQLGLGCFFFRDSQIYNKKKLASWAKKSGPKSTSVWKNSIQTVKGLWPVQVQCLPFLESDLIINKFPSMIQITQENTSFHWLNPPFLLTTTKHFPAWHFKPQQKKIKNKQIELRKIPGLTFHCTGCLIGILFLGLS